jgi:hypothetical protein
VTVLLVGVAVVVWMLLVTAAARDMDSRGRDGRLYGLVVFLLLPVGVVWWLVDHFRYPRVVGDRR